MCSKDYLFQTWIIEGEEYQKNKRIWWDRVAQYYGA